MKQVLLSLLSLLLAGGLLWAAHVKNIEADQSISGPPEDPMGSHHLYQSPRDSQKIEITFEKDGIPVSPPAPLPITETWPDGYFPQLHDPEPDAPYVTLETTMGSIKLVLYPEAAPLTVQNFLVHCQEGYYDDLTFHRVVPDFMIQGGDPTGTGRGGESIFGTPFRDEPNEHLHHFRGAVAMASWGTYLNGSQFYIVQGRQFQQTYRTEKAEAYKIQMQINQRSTEVYTRGYDYLFDESPTEQQFREQIAVWTNEANEQLRLGYQPELHIDQAMELYPEIGGAPHLDYKYTVFGQVVEGMEVVDAIADHPSDPDPVRILSTLVEHAPVDPAP